MYSHFNYIPHTKAARTQAKATLGYNETRQGKDGEAIERKLFGNGGPLTREQAEWLIENAGKNTYFFRWILAPDPNGENWEKHLDLWQLTRDGVAWLEERLHREGQIQLIGAEHDDHTGIPHIHAILLIERRGREKILTPKDINDFREAIRQMARKQRLEREQAQLQHAEKVMQSGPRQQPITVPPAHQELITPQPKREPAAATQKLLCLVCGGEKEGELIAKGNARCPVCGRELTRRKEAALSL
jgi:hypothetical protein